MTTDNKKYLSWREINNSVDALAARLQFYGLIENTVVLAPPYGGWPVASLIINQVRHLIGDPDYKPAVITENELSRAFLIPLLARKKIIIFDDVIDTGKVVNNIIWRIVHECETFLPKNEILDKIFVCTIGKKRDLEWPVAHFYTETWPTDQWIVYPWESN